MRRLKLVPERTNIDFVGKRLAAFVLSAMLVVGSLGVFATQGLNLGIDFLGGILVEVKTKGPANVSEMRESLGGLGLGEVAIQQFGGPDDVLIRVQRQPGGDTAQQEAVTTIKRAIDDVVSEYRRVETVGPTVGEELKEAAMWAILAAMGAILLYIWFRFEWQFGVGAVIALAHDIIATIGLFSVLQLEFNLATVAAVLTIAGYSINDTVVIFDRVRENLRRYKKKPLTEVFNLSINQTLSRTVMTSVTTLLALFALAAVGGPVIRDFTVALIWGVVIGTYSSVAIAVPALLFFGTERRRDPAAEGSAAEGSAADDEAADAKSG